MQHRVPITPALPRGVETAIPEEAPPSPDESLTTSPGLRADAEPALLEIQLGRIARRVLKTYWNGGEVMIPLAAWLDFAEVSHGVAGARVTGRLQPSRVTFMVDAESRAARVGERPLVVAESDLATIGGEVYTSLRLLTDLLGLGLIAISIASQKLRRPDVSPEALIGAAR